MVLSWIALVAGCGSLCTVGVHGEVMANALGVDAPARVENFVVAVVSSAAVIGWSAARLLVVGRAGRDLSRCRVEALSTEAGTA